MKPIRSRLAALGAALLLAACGGGGQTTPTFSALVAFGDSLSDVGTYRVGTVAALGGGKFTVNGPAARNWTEWIAEDIDVAAPCPAETGLLPNIPGVVGAPVTDAPACTNYAQGSARVNGVFAPSSASLQAPPFNQVNLGLLAVPVASQMAAHLAKVNGAYSGTELVTVLAGGNDLFMNFNAIASAQAGGLTAFGAAIAAGWSPAVQTQVAAGGPAATNAAVNAALAAMSQAGAELAGLVKTQVLAKGARFVVVVNLSDVSETPFALALDAPSQALINSLTTSFNAALQSGLAGTPVLLADLYTQGREQFAYPGQFGLTNVTTPACSSTSPANPLQGSSLGCTAASTIAGDTSMFLFADSVHPTPYGYQLLAQFVASQMTRAGWL
jgi:phospholipase/lecithinase/hemolysin